MPGTKVKTPHQFNPRVVELLEEAGNAQHKLAEAADLARIAARAARATALTSLRASCRAAEEAMAAYRPHEEATWVGLKAAEAAGVAALDLCHTTRSRLEAADAAAVLAGEAADASFEAEMGALLTVKRAILDSREMS